jgi:acyl carrier protein
MGSVSSRATVRDFVIETMGKKHPGLVISDQDDLLGLGVIDSLGVIQLVGFLEDSLKLKIGDDDILPENFQSIDAIAGLVDRNLGK